MRPSLPRYRLTRQRWWRLAAAALLLLALGLPGYLLLIREGDPVARAVRELDRIQHRHAEAIAVLERQAATVLDRAGDPELPAEQVAQLLGVRDRLNHLDAVIADVQGFLSEQPGHAGANKVLLAAYIEKDELLRTLLENDPGGLS